MYTVTTDGGRGVSTRPRDSSTIENGFGSASVAPNSGPPNGSSREEETGSLGLNVPGQPGRLRGFFHCRWTGTEHRLSGAPPAESAGAKCFGGHGPSLIPARVTALCSDPGPRPARPLQTPAGGLSLPLNGPGDRGRACERAGHTAQRRWGNDRLVLVRQ